MSGNDRLMFVIKTNDREMARHSAEYFKLEKLAISDALPLEATPPLFYLI